MSRTGRAVRLAGAVLLLAALATGAEAAQCGNSSAGVSQKVVASALSGASYDAGVISLDRHQGHFSQSFEHFYASRGAPLQGIARSRYQQNAALLKKIEQHYGVQGQVLVAIWGLETGFGANMGNKPTIRSLATLAYDCRRSAFFTDQLISALKVVQRGDLAPSQMVGAWAGELGQTQFLATSYLKFAVDFDGNGHRDLIHSRADALASTANYLKAYGWQAGGSWEPGTHNYAVLAQWNKAAVYQRTIAVLADKIGG
jgi:lytic murein transglycosylase